MTGVIYVGIIALWAAVLIPMWLRRHDQISEVRSTARFHSAMRTLSNSRTSHTVALSVAGEPGRMDDNDFEQYDYSYSSADARLRAADRELASRSAATRRAVVLGSLTAILLLTLLLAFAGVLPRWIPAIAVLPVVAFLIATSMTASARAEQSAPRQRAARPIRAPRRREEQVAAPAQAQRSEAVKATSSSNVMSDDEWANWNAWDEDDAWDAVPTTLPTYVSAPRASQVPRRIDRSRPGEWTGEAMVETAQAMRRPTSQPVAAAAGDETAEIPVVQAPRAVNE